MDNTVTEQELREPDDVVVTKSFLKQSETAFCKVLDWFSPTKGPDYLDSGVKRALDLSLSIPAVLLATPAMIIFGTAVKLDDGGSIFYIQERVLPRKNGDSQQGLKIIKFRSMRKGSDTDSKAVFEAARGNSEDQDPRVTRVGAFLRRYKFDELPQLFQVISGQLSLIGIRPMSQMFLEHIKEINHIRYEEYLKVYNNSRLGVSGVGQVIGTGNKKDEYRFHGDLFYIKNASLRLDLYLIWRTILYLLRYD